MINSSPWLKELKTYGVLHYDSSEVGRRWRESAVILLTFSLLFIGDQETGCQSVLCSALSIALGKYGQF